MGVPVFALIFYALPASSVGGALFVAGLLITWCGGCNNSIMAEIVAPQLRPTIYGLDRMLEGLVSPAGGLIAGRVAESFGFTQDEGDCVAGTAQRSADAAANATVGKFVNGGEDADSSGGGNAEALGNALAITCACHGSCAFAYTLLRTYDKDRRRGAHVGRRAGTLPPPAAGASSSPDQQGTVLTQPCCQCE